MAGSAFDRRVHIVYIVWSEKLMPVEVQGHLLPLRPDAAAAMDGAAELGDVK